MIIFWSFFDHFSIIFRPKIVDFRRFWVIFDRFSTKIGSQFIRAPARRIWKFLGKKFLKFHKGFGAGKTDHLLELREIFSFSVKKWSFFVDFWRFLTKNGQKSVFLPKNLQRKLTLKISHKKFFSKFPHLAGSAKFTKKKMWKSTLRNLQRKWVKNSKKACSATHFFLCKFLKSSILTGPLGNQPEPYPFYCRP